MKIPKKVVEQIVREEVLAHFSSLLGEADEPEIETADEEKPENKGKKKKDPKAKGDVPPAGTGQPDNVAPKKGAEIPPEQDLGDDEPADDELEQDAAEDETEEDPSDPKDKNDSVSDQITGKTIQSVTFNPKSKVLPGAKELTIQFEQSPEPFKIFITTSGDVKYMLGGTIHNEL